jgi:lipopolysaccharide export system protein LptA
MPILKRVVFVFLLLFPFALLAQDTTKIWLEAARFWKFDKDINPEYQRIIGDVVLRHDSIILYCDSAFLNNTKNNVVAFGNVHVKISDTLNIYGDSLKYNGNTKIGRIKGNVRLVDNETILTTDTLVFDRNTQIAQYDNWGKIVEGKNVLVSKHGYYYTNRKEFFYKEKVILMNPDNVMHSDTLMYNTLTHVAYFFGPSNIKGKEDSIYCENGWYNTAKNIARFRKKGQIYHQEQIVNGDSIYYERESGYGQIFKNANIIDTANKIILSGDYGELHRKRGSAFMTERAVAKLIDKKDTLFLHSDSIHAAFDTTQAVKKIRCFYKVKFFRRDLQGLCDSLTWQSLDSTLTLFSNPVLWSEKNQLTADTIFLRMKNNRADSMILRNAAFIISKDDSAKFNQIKGRDMVGYFINNELYKIRVIGNAETIYYAREDDRTLIGINKALSSNMLIFLDKNQLKSITYMGQPSAVLYPEKEMNVNDRLLKDFKWIEEKRPLTKDDIFVW